MSKRNIPVIPLRGTAVFPYTMITLDVGRKSSLIAIEKSVNNDDLVCLVQQVNASQEYPQAEDLYEIGVVAAIRQIIKVPGGLARVLVEGMERVVVISFKASNPYLQAEVADFNTVDEANDNILIVLRAVKEAFVKFLSLNHNIQFEDITALTDIDSAEQLGDLIGGNMPFSVEKKQELLETKSLYNRLEKLLAYLHEEIALLKIDQNIQKQVQEKLEDTQREYYLREQLRTIKTELGLREKSTPEFAKYTNKLSDFDLNKDVEEKLLQEIERLSKAPKGSPERSIIENYLNLCLSLPWNNLDNEDMEIAEAERILNEDHYGLKKVKERIIEYMAVLKLTNNLKGPILCFVGPPGVGKTSLAKSIARALGRKFISSSLGGIKDEAAIRGHRRTYVGAMPGRVIKSLKRVKTRNPLFLFDEIDKMSSDYRGDPSSAMLEVLDPEQNYQFTDHYLDLPFDLSKVIFVTTANTTHNIPKPLLDRMELITLPGYTEEEKAEIALLHLFPKQLIAHGLKKTQLKIDDKAIKVIINEYTREAGVRELERKIASICRKVAKKIVAKERTRFTISQKNVRDLLGKPIFRVDLLSDGNQVGIATALAYTEVGGETMPVEVVISSGEGKLKLTGKLGNVMKESAQTALSYLHSQAGKYLIPDEVFSKNDIHVHVPQGAVPKDGPSAGITIAVALLSALVKKPVQNRFGFTGEITLSGRVLPIGGLKEKLLAAKRVGVKTVIIPKANVNDLIDIPKSVERALKIIAVENVDQVLKVALKGD
ncbi:endopeptidase La [Clostridium sp. 'deep sea']|uniref:endopeptidase La n=1 Tax=Clostridium sp. 'deep sea' TaxID=2779445 RepID=UPI0018966E56|nr:endopeptidase La [Clostridium sp. 'deep sea']QOR36388.1 endopeptidase La [Clostridium sp. 'deep sea']